MSKVGDVLSKLVQLKRITDARKLFVIFWKKKYLMSLDRISHVFRAI